MTPLRLEAVRRLAPGIHRFELVDPAGGQLAPFAAGAHVEVELPGGFVRPYSLANDPAERHRYVLAVHRADSGRGGSKALFDEVRVGDLVSVGGPRNAFPLVEDGSPVVLIAGGIGITPIRSMALRLRTLGIEHRVHYAVRDRSDLAFVIADAEVHVDAEAGRVLDLTRVVGAAPNGAHLYCCGPALMLDSFAEACAGRPTSHVHVESFAPAPAPAGEGRGFIVELARSGERIDVVPGSTILDSLRSSGHEVVTSCEQGICGTCETGVVRGRPDHRDRLLSDDEKAANQSMMICCSLSLDDVLVLDL